MNIQGFQKLTLLDYPGKVACTVFTGGCNLRCPYCHNPSLVLPPPPGGMEAEVFAYLRQRRGLLDGVCVTGGEPLLQPELPRFLAALRGMGYLIKLDTNGTLPGPLRALLDAGLVDYIAMDIKAAPGHYSRAAGCAVDLRQIEASAALIRTSGVAHEFRTTLVKGIHTREDLASIGRWLAGEHNYFLQPFREPPGGTLGSGCAPFTPKELAALLHTVRESIPTAQLRGQ